MEDNPMNNKKTLALVGCGKFARHFMPLFMAHPSVEKLYVCDLIREKAEEFSRDFGAEIIDSYEEALASPEIDAILNFTERHIHGDIVIRALKAGKNVYSAVPMASKVEECGEIVELVKKTGLIYFMAETCYYYPCAMLCREEYEKGTFGDFCYGASQYYHNIDNIGYGKTAERGMPPLLYPTHSTAMILSTMDTYVTEVACFGYADAKGDPAFKKDGNAWGNEYVSQYVMMRLANGGVARVSEARSFGWNKPSSYISGFYGTKAGYEFSNAQHLIIEKDFTTEAEHVTLRDVSDYVNPADMVAAKNLPDFKERVANGEWQWSSPAEIQRKEVERVPSELDGIVSGHMSSHKLLVDDFMRALVSGKQPILNAWRAARYTVPGLVAIESCKMGGKVLPVPDFGAPEEE